MPQLLYDEAVDTALEPSWVALKDDELLAWRICDLGVRIEGSELEARVAQLYDEVAARGLAFRPACYLGDEWFSPEGVPAIAIPFYLAHPRLKTLELHQMLEVEGGTPEWCLMLLRHECGHAIDHAYRFSSRPEWRAIFGSPETEYAPETYQPRPYSKSFVRHLPNWYAQAHPDEDFAETFAVWLSMTPEQWREQYRGWKALDKLEYLHTLMEHATKNPPKVTRGRRISDAGKLKKHWPDITPSAASFSPKTSPISTTPTCALFSETASPMVNWSRLRCARIAGHWLPPSFVGLASENIL